MNLPLYTSTVIESPDMDACQTCPVRHCWGKGKAQQVDYKLYTRKDALRADNDPVDLLVIADAPSREDKTEFWSDLVGQTMLQDIKALGFDSFIVAPAIRCFPGGNIDHFTMVKKYKTQKKGTQRRTPLETAKAAIPNCSTYLNELFHGYNPKLTLAMGELATKTLAITDPETFTATVPSLRVTPLHPRKGLRPATTREGTVVTHDRYLKKRSWMADYEIKRDLESLKNIAETGYATPRGNRETIDVRVADTVKKVKQLVDWFLSDEMAANEVISFDFETAGLHLSREHNRILNVGFTRLNDEDVSYVVPLAHPQTPFTAEELAEVYKHLRRLFRSKGASFFGWLAHHAQFETEMVRLFFGVWLGEDGGKPVLDSEVFSYLLDEDRKESIKSPNKLETLASNFLGFRWYADTAIKSKRTALSDMPMAEVNEYVGIDASVTARLFNTLLDRAAAEGSSNDIMRLCSKLYAAATLYTTDMRFAGQLIDVALLRKLRGPDSIIGHRIAEIEEHFRNAPEVALAMEKLRGGKHKDLPTPFAAQGTSEFSLNSPDHKKALFWEVLQLDGADESVDKFWQSRHQSNPLVALYQEYQKLSKLDQAYLEPIARFLQSPNSPDGRLRPSFNLINTATGRLSASDPNCYDAETEILTNRGWVQFPDLRNSDQVAQWWPETKSIDFVLPTEVVRQSYTGPLVSLQNQHIDLVLTPNHRCPVVNRRTGALRVTTAAEYPEDYKQIHAGTWDGGTVSLSAAEVTLICAAQADGSWRNDVKQGAMEFTFSKARKIDRLRNALRDLECVYTENPKGEVYTRFYLSRCPGLDLIEQTIQTEKVFDPAWLVSLDRTTLDLFVAEVNHWDGCFTRNNQYTSTVKQNVDVVALAMTLSGLRATVNRHSSPDTPAWAVYQTPRDYSMTTNIVTAEVPYAGMVYCVTVPSSFVMVRRNGKPCVSGNSQQMPRGETKAGKQVKALFIAAVGYVLVQLDFSQAEVRWLGIMSGDKLLAKKYALAEQLKQRLIREPGNEEVKRALTVDGDIHMATALTMYKLPLDYPFTHPKEAKLARQRAKAVCFGLIYGKGAKALASDLGITVQEADEAIQLWLDQFPQADAWLTQIEEYAMEHNCVISPFGRWRRLPEVNADDVSVSNRAKRQARNTPIQSAASDTCIFAACTLRARMRANPELFGKVKLINSVHDSLVAEVPADPAIITAYATLARDTFSDPELLRKDWGLDITVPLAVDFDIGANWGSMRDYEFTEVSLARCLHDAEVMRNQPPGTLFDDLKGQGLLYDEAVAQGKAA